MSLKEKIVENILYKIISILCGIGLWFAVTGEKNSDINIDIPLEFKNIPSQYIITNISDQKISLLLGGPSSLLKMITKKELSFPINLSDVQKGKNEIHIYPHMLNLPHNVSVKIVTPSKVTINVDKIVTEVKPVIPKMDGKANKGFKIKDIIVEPNIIKIIGAENEIKKINVLKTEPINIEKRDTSFEVEKNVITDSSHIKSISPNKVKIKVLIEEKTSILKFEDIPIKINAPFAMDSYNIKLNPEKISIQCEISDNLKEGIKKSNFTASINLDVLNNLNTSKKYKVSITSPPEVKILSISSEEATLTITETKNIKKPEK